MRILHILVILLVACSPVNSTGGRHAGRLSHASAQSVLGTDLLTPLVATDEDVVAVVTLPPGAVVLAVTSRSTTFDVMSFTVTAIEGGAWLAVTTHNRGDAARFEGDVAYVLASADAGVDAGSGSAQ